MRVVRFVLAATIVASSAVAAYRLCWMRYQCEVQKGALDRQLQRALDDHDPRIGVVGRAAIPPLTACVENHPDDFHSRFLLAKAAEATGQEELALSMYEAALHLNERPEIYARIGVLQLKTGRPEEARRNLMRAVMFATPFAGTVSDPLRTELFAAGAARKQRLEEKARRDGH